MRNRLRQIKVSCTELKLEILEAAPGAAPEPYVEDFNCPGLLEPRVDDVHHQHKLK